MRTFMRVLVSMVLVVGGLAAVPAAPATAEPAVSGPAAGTRAVRYADYLDAGALAGNGADQCAKTIAERVGAWTCLTGSAPHATIEVPGFCQANACWNQYSTTHSDFAGWGAYGYGQTTIGTVNVAFDVTMNGARATDKPVSFTSSAYVNSLEIEGNRLYYSAAKPNGDQVNGGKAWAAYTHGPLAANVPVYWLPNGYVSYESTVAIGGVTHEWIWTDPNYPGNWYLWGKSIKFNRQSSGAYYFGGGTYLPPEKFGAGWHAN